MPGVDADDIELALDTIKLAMARYTLADCSPVERAGILRNHIDRIEVLPDCVKLLMYQPDGPENKEPQPFGRGFAPETGIGTPKRI